MGINCATKVLHVRVISGLPYVRSGDNDHRFTDRRIRSVSRDMSAAPVEVGQPSLAIG